MPRGRPGRPRTPNAGSAPNSRPPALLLGQERLSSRAAIPVSAEIRGHDLAVILHGVADHVYDDRQRGMLPCQPREVVLAYGVEAGIGQAHRVEHATGELRDSRGAVAGPRLGGDCLGHETAKAIQVHDPGKFPAESRRPRRKQQGIPEAGAQDLDLEARGDHRSLSPAIPRGRFHPGAGRPGARGVDPHRLGEHPEGVLEVLVGRRIGSAGDGEVRAVRVPVLQLLPVGVRRIGREHRQREQRLRGVGRFRPVRHQVRQEPLRETRSPEAVAGHLGADEQPHVALGPTDQLAVRGCSHQARGGQEPGDGRSARHRPRRGPPGAR